MTSSMDYVCDSYEQKHMNDECKRLYFFLCDVTSLEEREIAWNSILLGTNCQKCAGVR